MLVEWLRKAPTSVKVTVIVVCGVLALGVLGAYVLLTLNGYDTAEFRTWINTIANLVVLPLVGVGTVAAVSAAKSSSQAEEQTNGHLHAKEAENMALRRQIEELRARLGEGRNY